jgi:hypothetical protein
MCTIRHEDWDKIDKRLTLLEKKFSILLEQFRRYIAAEQAAWQATAVSIPETPKREGEITL